MSMYLNSINGRSREMEVRRFAATYNLDIEMVKWWISLQELFPDPVHFQPQFEEIQGCVFIDKEGICVLNEFVEGAGDGSNFDLNRVLCESRYRLSLKKT